MRGSSQAATSVFLRKLRLRFWDFFVRMWLAKAFSRLSRPEPVTLKRFFAPLFDFIFGIATTPLAAILHDGVPPQKSRHYTHAATNTFPAVLLRNVQSGKNFKLEGENCKLQIGNNSSYVKNTINLKFTVNNLKFEI